MRMFKTVLAPLAAISIFAGGALAQTAGETSPLQGQWRAEIWEFTFTEEAGVVRGTGRKPVQYYDTQTGIPGAKGHCEIGFAGEKNGAGFRFNAQGTCRNGDKIENLGEMTFRVTLFTKTTAVVSFQGGQSYMMNKI